MVEVVRQTGLQTTVGTVYSPNCNLYKLTVQDSANSNIDLRAEDDAVNEVVEAIVKELNPLAYFTTNDNSGTMHLVLDISQNSASEIQTQVRRIGYIADDSTKVGPNDIDISGSDVVAATSFTVA